MKPQRSKSARWQPNDESDSNTSKGMYKDLNDGRYEKTIYVKTWTGRTITVVFSPERATRFMKKENRKKDRDPNGSPAARGRRKSPHGQRIVEGKWSL